jgi:transposase
VIADRGYDSDGFRWGLEGNNNLLFILRRKSRKEEIEYDKAKYKKRGTIERIFGKLKEDRRLTVRYEKPGIIFLGFIVIAFLKIFFVNSV